MKTVNITFQEGTDEAEIVKNVIIDREYNFAFKPTDVVLNLGGHIGCFDVFAYEKVSQIITVEPSPENIQKLQKNISANKISNSTILQGAVSNYDGIGKFYLNERNALNSVMGGEKEIEVIFFSLKGLLDKYKPTKIKCDIEGGEYDAFLGVELKGVNEMWFEIHLKNDKSLQPKYEQLVNELRLQGFMTAQIQNDENDVTYLLHCTRGTL